MTKHIVITTENIQPLERCMGVLYAGQPPVPPNLIATSDIVGTEWSKDLEPGKYTFYCAVWGPAGDVGPIVVKDGDTTLASVPGHIPGAPGTFHGVLIAVPFTVVP